MNRIELTEVNMDGVARMEVEHVHVGDLNFVLSMGSCIALTRFAGTN